MADRVVAVGVLRITLGDDAGANTLTPGGALATTRHFSLLRSFDLFQDQICFFFVPTARCTFLPFLQRGEIFKLSFSFFSTSASTLSGDL